MIKVIIERNLLGHAAPILFFFSQKYQLKFNILNAFFSSSIVQLLAENYLNI